MPLLTLFLALLAAPAATQEPPAKFQVDLVFPRNETYVRTAFFPVVYAVRNFQLADSLDLRILGSLETDGRRNFQEDASGDITRWVFPAGYLGFSFGGESPDADPLFFIESTRYLTNGTDTHFHVEWDASLDNYTGRWISGKQRLEFSIAPDGKVPDIAEAIRSCGYKSVAVDIPNAEDSVNRHRVLKDIEPTDQCGTLTDYADEVAANASKYALTALSCKNGEWQEIREICSGMPGKWGQYRSWLALVASLIVSTMIL